MSDAFDTAAMLRTTLELERAATTRYAEHLTWGADPRLCAYWEGLRRNEAEHHGLMVDELRRLGIDATDQPVDGPPTGEAPLDAPPLAIDPAASLRERGYVRTLAALRADLAFERGAVEIYATFTKRLAEPRLKAVLRDFTRAETGHFRGLKAIIARVEDTSAPVLLYCPTCGWELDLGADPPDGLTVHCPMCGMDFRVSAQAGDFVLDRA
jgi:rubrerythrin